MKRKIGMFLFSLLALSTSISAEAANQKQVKTNNRAQQEVQSSSVQKYPIQRSGTTLFSEEGNYQMGAIGNSNCTGASHSKVSGDPVYLYFDCDNDPDTFSSTSAELTLRDPDSKIVKAFVTLSSHGYLSNPDTAFIEGPKGGRFIFDAPHDDAAYDITEFVQKEGAGTYWGKNIEVPQYSSSADVYANWEIVYVEDNPNMANSRKTVLDFYGNRLSGAVTLDITKDNIDIPQNQELSSGLLVTGSGGESRETFPSYPDTATIIATDENGNTSQKQYSEVNRPEDDFFNESITKNGEIVTSVNPYRKYMNTDIIVNDNIGSDYLPINTKGLKLALNIDSGAVKLNYIGLSVDVVSPKHEVETTGQKSKTDTERIYKKADLKTIIYPSSNELSLGKSYYELKLPKEVSMTEEELKTIRLNGKEVTNVSTSTDKQTIRIPISTDPITSAQTLTYSVQCTKKFKKGTIKGSFHGKVFDKNNIEINRTFYTTPSSLYLQKVWKVTYQQKIGDLSVKPHSTSEVDADATLLYLPPNEPDAQEIGYTLDEDKKVIAASLNDVMVNAVNKDTTITYHYKKNKASIELLYDLNRNKHELTFQQVALDEQANNKFETLQISYPNHVRMKSNNAPSEWKSYNMNHSVLYDIRQKNNALDITEFLQSVILEIEKDEDLAGKITITLQEEQVIGRVGEDNKNHYYKFVFDNNNWFTYYNQAKEEKYNGLTGYLMTITSEEEHDFVYNAHHLQTGFFGGTRLTYPDGKKLIDATHLVSDENKYDLNQDEWYWIDGPEKGEVFYIGKHFSDVQNVPGKYANWAPNEPNDSALKKEYILQLGHPSGKGWNDFTAMAENQPSWNQGYFVEFSEYGSQKETTTKLPNKGIATSKDIPQRILFKGYDTLGNPLAEADQIIDENISVGQNYQFIPKDISGYTFTQVEGLTMNGVIKKEVQKGKAIYQKNQANQLIVRFLSEEGTPIAKDVVIQATTNLPIDLSTNKQIIQTIETIEKEFYTLKTRPADENNLIITQPTMTIDYIFSGSIGFVSYPDNWTFADGIVTNKPQTLPYNMNKKAEIVVQDNRVASQKGKFSISAKLTTDFSDIANQTLPGTVIQLVEPKKTQTISTTESTIYTNTELMDQKNQRGIILDEGAAITNSSSRLNVYAPSVTNAGTYTTKITWTLNLLP